MRLSRTDFAPLLAILAGGAIGVSFTLAPSAAWSPPDQVPTSVRIVLPPTAEVPPAARPTWSPAAPPTWSPTGEVIASVSPDGKWVAVRSAEERTALLVRGVVASRTSRQSTDQPLVYVDRVRMATSSLGNLDPDDIESIEVIKGAAAAALYGEEASAGVIQVVLKKRRERD